MTEIRNIAVNQRSFPVVNVRDDRNISNFCHFQFFLIHVTNSGKTELFSLSTIYKSQPPLNGRANVRKFCGQILMKKIIEELYMQI